MVTKRRRLSEPQKPTSQNPQNGLSRPLVNFKSAVLRVAAEKLNRPLTAAEVGRIDKDLVAKLRVLSHTPDHPPYAAMIRTALLELNEEGGSSEESISNFIIKEFPDLPWAHSAFLKHHLSNLRDNEEIFLNSDNCYLLIDEKALTLVSSESNKPNKQMKIKFKFSKNEPKKETIVSEYLPLAVVDEDQEVLDCDLRGSSETLINYVENVKETCYVENVKNTCGRQLRSADLKKKPEVASTKALPKSQPQEPVKCRGRGRPRKITSSEEIKAEKLQNLQQLKRRGRPRKWTH